MANVMACCALQFCVATWRISFEMLMRLYSYVRVYAGFSGYDLFQSRGDMTYEDWLSWWTSFCSSTMRRFSAEGHLLLRLGMCAYEEELYVPLSCLLIRCTLSSFVQCIRAIISRT